MDEFTPRHYIHRGTVLAEAFLLSAKVVPVAEIRKRAIGVWREGVRIFGRGDDLIVMLPDAAPVDSRFSPGLPFVRVGEILTAFPTTSEEFEMLDLRPNCLVRFSEGRLEVIHADELIEADLGGWFDFADFEVVRTEPLGEVVKPTLTETLLERPVDIRGSLKDLPPADERLSSVLAKLNELKAASEKGTAGGLFGTGARSGSGGGTVSHFFTATLNNLKNLFRTYEGPSTSGALGGGTPTFQQLESSGLSKLYTHLKNFTVRTVLELRMGHIFGRRQARYLMEMMEKFERGDLNEALKYAIPLEDMQALSDLMRRSGTLFAPRPRKDLQISLGSSYSTPTIGIGPEWFDHLKQLYRRSFERLEAQGRFEEAAFVLAELLKSNDEAVEFLSKHGRFRLAAGLAESRNLPKEVVVRQWYQAGERGRAVRIAVLHDCFEYVVTKLEQQGFESASELRGVWAESLAQRGDYCGAVEVIWKLEERRSRAKEWVDSAVGFGGALGARMLAKKALLYPEKFNEIREDLVPILEGSGVESTEKRAAFARAILAERVNNELRVLARPVVRKMLSDAHGGAGSLQAEEFHQLVALTGDRALRTDLPNFPQRVPPIRGERDPFKMSIPPEDKGSLKIHDVLALPEGRLAVALGEAGVKVLNRKGKSITWFDQPAHQLIPSDTSTKAIAVANRGGSVRLSRIDFAERRAAYWCDAVVDHFAPDYDGKVWFVGVGNEFHAIHANAKNFETLWSVPNVDGMVRAVARSKFAVEFLTGHDQGFDTWIYELPGLTLRRRSERAWLSAGEPDVLGSANISASTCSMAITETESENVGDGTFFANIFQQERRTLRFELPPNIRAVGLPQVSEAHGAVVAYSDEDAQVYLFSATGHLAAKFSFGSANQVSINLDESSLKMADDCGRVLVYEHRTAALIRNARL